MQKLLRVPVRQVGDVQVNCPRCMDRKTLPYDKIAGEHRVRIICSCKQVFDILLEYRKKNRKKTNLDAYFEKITTSSSAENNWTKDYWNSQSIKIPRHNSTIKNISMDGIGIVTSHATDIKPNDLLRMRFLLDNSAQSVIDKVYLVKGIKKNYIGCMNFRQDQNDKTLGFYVLS